jgi:hypothetical protein
MTQPRRPDPKTSIAVVLPLRRLDEHGKPVVIRRACRPRRVEKAPTIDERVYEATIAAEAERAIEQDGVVRAASGADAKLLLDHLIAAAAVETAGLKHDRERAVRAGRDAAKLSTRRIAGLSHLAELILVRERIRREDPEPDPRQVALLVEMLVECVSDVVQEVAEPQVADLFMARLKLKMGAADFPASAAPGSSRSS